MKRIMIIITPLPFAGCASAPREQLPPVAWQSESEAMQILSRRAEQVKTVSAQGLMTMRRPDGQSVRLDVALAGDANRRLRIRAWKLGRAVFDLTMNADGVWMLLPDDPSIRTRLGEGQLDLRRIADTWDLFNGRFFASRGVTMHDAGRRLLASGTIDSSSVKCTIDPRTLTPRLYVLRDSGGVERFSLALSQYQMIAGLPVARRYAAKSEMGEIIISLHDVELNGELADGAFIPPRRAEKLK